MPEVDIIIRAKNGHEMTGRLIASILANTQRDGFRLIVVDDGSDPPLDTSRADCAVRHAVCRGAVTATNSGIALAMQRPDIPYILVLDNDTEIPAGDADWLPRFVSEMQAAGPQTGAMGATSGFVSGHQHALRCPQTYAADWEGGSKTNPPVGTFVSFAVLLRKEAVAACGFWDERYNPGNWEDTDYAASLRVAGWQVKVARSVYIHHKGHQTFREDIQRLLAENQQKFIQKWGLGRLLDLGFLSREQMMQALAGQANGV